MWNLHTNSNLAYIDTWISKTNSVLNGVNRVSWNDSLFYKLI